MRTTLVLDDKLMAEAQQYSGLTEKSAIVRLALQSFVQHQAALELARLGGSDPDAWAPGRRRFDPE
jgi:Arc/MetJ family transcription regulator